jgi:acyl carrier protein
MIPSVFVRLDTLPATDNGKVDRASLPLPSLNNMLPERASSALPEGVQAGVASIVCDLLHVEQIGVDENFFLSGGHSLLGAQVIARLRDAFGVELPLRMIFRHPTVAKLSSEVEKLLAEQTTQNGNEAALVLDEWSAA